ncbi:MAG: MFS transporter [Candidatus Bathyarchaeota archaeon]|nr:MAG: MFS transporter [Candidatus Bathyarchaeota archaeon]
MGSKKIRINGLEESENESRSILPFSILYTGQVFSLLGSRLVQFSIVWWLTSTTGSASVLALGSIIAMLPQVLVSPFAGVLIDRWNRRRVMIVTDTLIALAVVVLAVLYAWDLVSVWHIYGLMFVRSVGGAFHWLAWQSSRNMLVPERHLSRVAGLDQSINGIAGFVAPPMGALLMGFLPIHMILALDVATAAMAIAPLLFIKIPQPPFLHKNGRSSVFASMKEGFNYIRAKTGVLLIVAMAMAINFILTPAFSLQPILVTNHFGGGAIELGLLQSAHGIGLILGGLALSVWGGFKRRAVTSLLALAVSGVFFAIIGLAPPTAFMIAVGASFAAGLLNPMVNGPLMAILQAKVPTEVQGRVFSLIQTGAQLIVPLGLAIGGPFSDTFGVPILFLLGGTIMSIMGAGAFLVRPILYVEDANFDVETLQGNLGFAGEGVKVPGAVSD